MNKLCGTVLVLCLQAVLSQPPPPRPAIDPAGPPAPLRPTPKCNNVPVADAIYCAIPGKSPSITAVKYCGGTDYCHRYLPDVGVCCPRPTMVCPSGYHAKYSCDPRRPPSQCGFGHWFCYKYMDEAGVDDPSAGSICCPNVPGSS